MDDHCEGNATIVNIGVVSTKFSENVLLARSDLRHHCIDVDLRIRSCSGEFGTCYRRYPTLKPWLTVAAPSPRLRTDTHLKHMFLKIVPNTLASTPCGRHSPLWSLMPQAVGSLLLTISLPMACSERHTKRSFLNKGFQPSLAHFACNAFGFNASIL